LPRYTLGGVFLDSIAARDFVRLAAALTPDVTMQALVPSGLRELTGRNAVCTAFAGWFDDLTDYQMQEAILAEVADRLLLQWRIRVRAGRLGDGWFLVEQHAFAESAADGRIDRLRLLCSGYRPDPEA
jgi:hypothetical protein